MEATKIERLLRLIMMMADKVDYTIEDISEKLGITPRSTYRYIETLRTCGFAIDKRKANLYKLVKIPNSSINFNKLIYFTEEEAHIINNLISSLDNTNSLKTALQKKLCTIYSLTNMAELITDKASAHCIESLGNAIRTKSKVILKRYESGHSKSIADRHIEPFAFTTNYIDVWAYDLDKRENRIFKIARIGEVVVLSESWEFENMHRKTETDCFRMNGSEQIPIKLELSIRAKNLLIEEYPLAEKEIELIDDKWILDTNVRCLEGVGRFVIGLAGDINIIDSPSLEAYIQNYIEEHLKRYIK